MINQIYPRSFADTDGDGIGDLRGIAEHLDYLNDGTDGSLGVAAIWLSPFYRSPMADFGYDISDYADVDPLFGTMEDFDHLLGEAYRRGIRVVVDWVPNHLSDQHPWFVESASGRNSAERDWYIWRDPAPDGDRRTTGGRHSPPSVRRGRSTRRPDSTTCTRSCTASPTSTGTTPR